MAQLVRLDPAQHGDLRMVEGATIAAAVDQHVIILRANEVVQAAGDFPVFITRDPEYGVWAISAMCAFAPDTNLFAHNGVWYATYQPTSMQTFPVYVMDAPGTEKGYAFGVREGEPALAADGTGQRLFEDDGSPSAFLSQVMAMLEADIDNDARTRRFLDRLHELELTRAIDLQVHYADGAVNTLQGLRTIDEARLQSLSPELLSEFNANGYLKLMHALLASTFRLNALIRLQDRREDLTPVLQVRIEKSGATPPSVSTQPPEQ